MNADDLIPLAQAARLTPGRPSPQTIWRWITDGLHVNGERICLEGRYVGRRLYTSRPWLDAFHRRCTEARQRGRRRGPTPVRTMPDDVTEEELREVGLL